MAFPYSNMCYYLQTACTIYVVGIDALSSLVSEEIYAIIENIQGGTL